MITRPSRRNCLSTTMCFMELPCALLLKSAAIIGSADFFFGTALSDIVLLLVIQVRWMLTS